MAEASSSSSSLQEQEYERNRLVAEDEAKWVSDLGELDVPGALKFHASFHAATVLHNRRPEPEGVQYRVFRRGDKMCIHKAPFAYDVVCFLAVRDDDGREMGNGEDAVVKIFPEYRVKTCVPVGGRESVTAGPLFCFDVVDGVRMALLLREPRLRTNQATDIQTSILKALNEQNPEYTVTLEGTNDASRKERQCSACGIVWRKTMMRCSRCKVARYCSKACQKQAWSEHKKSCGQSNS